MLTHAHEGAHDVEVVHLHQLAAPAVEEHQLAEREQLERAAEARAGAARPPGDAAQLAVVAAVEVDESVALAERATADHDRPGLVERHSGRPAHHEVRRKPNSRSALSSLRHSDRTRTVSSRKTLIPKNLSRSVRALDPMRLSIVAPLPITIPRCDSRSTKITARMYRHSGRRRSVSSSTRTAQAYGTSWWVSRKIFSRIASATQKVSGWSVRVSGGKWAGLSGNAATISSSSASQCSPRSAEIGTISANGCATRYAAIRGRRRLLGLTRSVLLRQQKTGAREVFSRSSASRSSRAGSSVASATKQTRSTSSTARSAVLDMS